MTKSDLDRISRSWVGHIATSPDLRETMNKVLAKGPAGDEEMADLINQTVIPKDNVSKDDVPAIKAHIDTMLAPGADPGGGITLQFHGKEPNV
jgi:hypothetical protein